VPECCKKGLGTLEQLARIGRATRFSVQGQVAAVGDVGGQLSKFPRACHVLDAKARFV
jgi:hypothetical protein